MFPEAIQLIIVFHVTEYLWEAGHALFKEGSEELIEWVERQKKALYEGQVAEIVSELELQLRLSEAKAVTNACEKFATT